MPDSKKSSMMKLFDKTKLNKKNLIKGAKIVAGVAAVAAAGYIIYKGIEYKQIISKQKNISNLFSNQEDAISFIYDPTIKAEWKGDVGLSNLFFKEYLINRYKDKVCTIPKPYVSLIFNENGTLDVFTYNDKDGNVYVKKIFTWKEEISQLFKKDILEPCKGNLTVLSIYIEILGSLHSNLLIYNKSKNTIEHYEPYGNYILPKNRYNSFEIFFQNMGITYYSPHITCPRFGPQSHELKCQNSFFNFKSPGFCVLWSLWMADLRITYPNAKSSELIESSIKEITGNNIGNLCVFIIAYAQFILKFCQKYDVILYGGNVVSYTLRKN